MKPQTVGFIFARGGSKGIPRKNLRLLAGKPLIAHSIQTALACSTIDHVIVSTDDLEIADVARQFGAAVPFMRPADLARDDTPEWLAWQHALRTLPLTDLHLKPDVFVSVPPTSPLRSVEDLENCIETLLTSDADLIVTIKHSDRNPYFNMVRLDDSGYVTLAAGGTAPIYRRQDAPTVYDMTTVAYVARPDFILNSHSWLEGRVRAVIVPNTRALDVDSELDFQFAEYLLAQSSIANSSTDRLSAISE